MEALSVDEVPQGKHWQYEPKWDGFRCLVFRNNTKIELQSKSGQSLTRYFPELVSAVEALKARRFVPDSEIVVPRKRAFSFDDLHSSGGEPGDAPRRRDTRTADRVRPAERR
jgi:ATP-dependent DNA ligase